MGMAICFGRATLYWAGGNKDLGVATPKWWRVYTILSNRREAMYRFARYGRKLKWRGEESELWFNEFGGFVEILRITEEINAKIHAGEAEIPKAFPLPKAKTPKTTTQPPDGRPRDATLSPTPRRRRDPSPRDPESTRTFSITVTLAIVGLTTLYLVRKRRAWAEASAERAAAELLQEEGPGRGGGARRPRRAKRRGGRFFAAPDDSARSRDDSARASDVSARTPLAAPAVSPRHLSPPVSEADTLQSETATPRPAPLAGGFFGGSARGPTGTRSPRVALSPTAAARRSPVPFSPATMATRSPPVPPSPTAASVAASEAETVLSEASSLPRSPSPRAAAECACRAETTGSRRRRGRVSPSSPPRRRTSRPRVPGPRSRSSRRDAARPSRTAGRK